MGQAFPLESLADTMSSPEETTSVPHSDIEINLGGDLTIMVHEYKPSNNGEPVNPDDPKAASLLIQTAAFKVSLAALTRVSYFSSLLSGRWAESNREVINLHGDTVRSIQVWLNFFHRSLYFDSITVEDVWHVIMAGDKYDFKVKNLRAWFTNWYEKNKPADPREFRRTFAPRMLFPCFAFDFAEGFQETAKVMVYRATGHIHEINPTAIRQVHLPPRVIQQLNAARGRLRSILHRVLFANIRDLVHYGSCDCKEKTVFRYLHELDRLEVWPLEDRMVRASVQDMLTRLRGFDLSFNMTGEDPAPSRSCLSCTINWNAMIDRAIRTVNEYFDGLCLDCMNMSKKLEIGRDNDDDYWHHNDYQDSWDQDCRIKHGEPTWYFSFMGRREKRGLIADV